jgi:hypothetical protein
MCSKIFENVISPFCGTGSLIGIGALNEEDFEVVPATFTPLFQTCFDPTIRQVNFIPEEIMLWPNVGHLVPALGAAAVAGVAKTLRTRSGAIASERSLFISEVL